MQELSFLSFPTKGQPIYFTSNKKYKHNEESLVIGRNRIPLETVQVEFFGAGFKPFSGKISTLKRGEEDPNPFSDERTDVSGGLDWEKNLPNCSL